MSRRGAGRVGEQFLWETTVLCVHFCYNCTKTIKFINHLNDKHGVSLLLSSGQVEPAAIALAGFRGVPGAAHRDVVKAEGGIRRQTRKPLRDPFVRIAPICSQELLLFSH